MVAKHLLGKTAAVYNILENINLIPIYIIYMPSCLKRDVK